MNQAPSWTENVNDGRRTPVSNALRCIQNLEEPMAEFEEQLGRDSQSFSPARVSKIAVLI